MTVHWEVEYPGMQLHESQAVWTMKNVGDETAHAHSQVGEITIWQHPDPHNPSIDSTPWTNPLTLDRDVPHGTAHTMTYPLHWTGQQHGTYTAAITLGEGTSAEMYFEATQDGIAPPYR